MIISLQNQDDPHLDTLEQDGSRLVANSCDSLAEVTINTQLIVNRFAYL